MKYTHQHKFTKAVDLDFEKRMRFVAKVGLFYSVAVLLIGVAIALIFNINRYDKVVGDPMHVNVAVYDTRAVDITDEATGSVQTMYKPVGNFNYQGYSCDVLLGEGYVVEEYAREEVGEIREIVVDSATLEEVPIKPYNYFGVCIAGVGCICATVCILLWLYYAKWNEPYSFKQLDKCRIYG